MKTGSSRQQKGQAYKLSQEFYELAAEYIFKIVLVGDAAVGKSNLLLRFTKNEFSHGTKTTIGMEMTKKVIQMESDK